MPDIHHKANYAIGALAIAGCIGLGVHSAQNTATISSVKEEVASVAGSGRMALSSDQIQSLATALAPIPKHDFVVYCIEDCGPFARSVVKGFHQAHWKAHIERVLAGTASGLMVSPSNQDGHAIANAISSATGLKVTTGDQDKGETYNLLVGAMVD